MADDDEMVTVLVAETPFALAGWVILEERLAVRTLLVALATDWEDEYRSRIVELDAVELDVVFAAKGALETDEEVVVLDALDMLGSTVVLASAVVLASIVVLGSTVVLEVVP